jgi:hypothetical protein
MSCHDTVFHSAVLYIKPQHIAGKEMDKQVFKERVLNGQEQYGWLDSGATSNFVVPQDKQQAKGLGKPSTKVMRIANG